jgi:hypothetical protein
MEGIEMAWVRPVGEVEKEQENFLLLHGSKADKKRIKAIRAERAAAYAEIRAARAAKKKG